MRAWWSSPIGGLTALVITAAPASAAVHYRVVHTVHVGPDPVGVAVDPTTHFGYVTRTKCGRVAVIDEATHAVTDTIRVGAGPAGVAVDPTTHTVYVANSRGGTVSVIDEATDTVTHTVRVGAGPAGVAVDPTIHTAYVISSGGGGTVSWILETSNTARTYALDIEPGGIAADPVDHLVYITFPGIGEVGAFGIGPTGFAATFVELGGTPTGVAVDPADGVFVTNGVRDRVWVIAPGSQPPKSTGVLRVTGPLGVAVDTASHVAYVTSPGVGTVALIQPS